MCWLVVLQFSEQTHTVCSENWEEMTACTVFFSSIFAKWWHATGLTCGLLEMHATVFILSQAFSSLTGISGWATAFLLASRGAEWVLEPVLQFQDAVCWEAQPQRQSFTPKLWGQSPHFSDQGESTIVGTGWMEMLANLWCLDFKKL